MEMIQIEGDKMARDIFNRDYFGMLFKNMDGIISSILFGQKI